MFPEFDPAIARVLEIASRLGASIDADEVARALAAEDDPVAQALSRDRAHVQRALQGLTRDGLLEADDSGRYHLTVLGQARIARAVEED